MEIFCAISRHACVPAYVRAYKHQQIIEKLPTRNPSNPEERASLPILRKLSQYLNVQ